MVVTVVVALLLGAGSFVWMLAQDRTYVSSAPFAPEGEVNREAVVVYYSRSGHTEAVAREAARVFNCPIARIEADYPLDWDGWRKSAHDARGQVTPPVRVEPVDLGSARLVILASPTWWFRPAPPLWAFVEQADLTGKQVVLMTTGNSRFKQEETDAFARRVEARGGTLVQHVFLPRGRFFSQLTREALLEEARAQVAPLKRFLGPRDGGSAGP